MNSNRTRSNRKSNRKGINFIDCLHAVRTLPLSTQAKMAGCYPDQTAEIGRYISGLARFILAHDVSHRWADWQTAWCEYDEYRERCQTSSERRQHTVAASRQS